MSEITTRACQTCNCRDKINTYPQIPFCLFIFCFGSLSLNDRWTILTQIAVNCKRDDIFVEMSRVKSGLVVANPQMTRVVASTATPATKFFFFFFFFFRLKSAARKWNLTYLSVLQCHNERQWAKQVVLGFFPSCDVQPSLPLLPFKWRKLTHKWDLRHAGAALCFSETSRLSQPYVTMVPYSQSSISKSMNGPSWLAVSSLSASAEKLLNQKQKLNGFFSAATCEASY